MSIEFGSFVRSKEAAFVRSPLRVRNPSCGYFPDIAKKFSISISTQGRLVTSYPPYTTNESRWHVSGDGYPARNNPGTAEYWVPTIVFAPGVYRGSWTVNRSGQTPDTIAAGTDLLEVHLYFMPTYTPDDFVWHNEISTRNWEVFRPIPRAPPSHGGDTMVTSRAFSNNLPDLRNGQMPWPNGGDYEWPSGKSTSYWDRYNIPEDVLALSNQQRWKCPGRIWILINVTNFDSVFTLTGDSTND